MGKKKKARTVDPELVADAKAHPEYTTIQLGSKEYGFLLNMTGAEIARDEGHDPVPAIFNAVERLIPAFLNSDLVKEAAKKGVDLTEANITYMDAVKILMKVIDGELISDFCLIVWWGVLTVHPDTSLARVKVNLTPASIRAVFEQVWPKMLTYTRDLTEEDLDVGGSDESEGDEEGK